MNKVLLLTILTICYGCTNISKSDKNNLYSDSISSDYYANVKNYSFPGGDHFSKFVAKYGPKISFSHSKNQMSIESIRNNYKPREIDMQKIASWINESYHLFSKDISYTVKSGPFHFQVFDRGFPRTLFYVHDNVSSSAYVWDFVNQLRSEIKGVNVVFVDQTLVNRNHNEYSFSEVESLFGTGATEVINLLTKKYVNHKFFFNVICHAQIYTYKFLSESKDVSAVVYYAPMVKKNDHDKVVDFERVFQDEKETDFQNVLYLFNLGEYGYASNMMIPRNHSSYNVRTEINLLKKFNEGFDLSKIANKYLLYPEIEGLLNLESYGTHFFEDKKIFKMSGFKHVDFYSQSPKKMRYLNLIEEIINKY